MLGVRLDLFLLIKLILVSVSDFQVLLYIGKKARSKTLTACKMNLGVLGSFNYWDWPGAEKYLN